MNLRLTLSVYGVRYLYSVGDSSGSSAQENICKPHYEGVIYQDKVSAGLNSRDINSIIK